jgi:hypothetical protein
MAMQDVIDRIFKLSPENSDNVTMEEGATFSPEDDSFFVVAQADPTKRLKFDASGVTTATTRTIAVPDADVTFGGAGAKRTVVDTGGAFATPIVLTAADSGKIYLLDDAAGLDFTLPAIAAADVGIEYTFFVTVTNTSNSYRFTAASGDLLRGNLLLIDTNAVYTAPQAVAEGPNESSHLVLDLTSDATGGMLGGWFTITAITATGWFLRGVLQADGTITSPFA